MPPLDDAVFDVLRPIFDKIVAAGFERAPVHDFLVGTPLEAPDSSHVRIDKSCKAELEKAVAAIPSFSEFHWAHLNRGTGSSLVNLAGLVAWLAWRLSSVGVDQTLEGLAAYFSHLGNPASKCVALAGVELSECLDLGDGIVMTPIDKMPRSYALDSIEPPVLRETFWENKGLRDVLPYPLLVTVPHCVLVETATFKPRTFDPTNLPPPKAVNFERLEDALLALTLVKQAAPIALAYWVQLDPLVPCANQGGDFSMPGVEVSQGRIEKVSADDHSEIRSVCASFRSLNSGLRARLRVPLQRLNRYRRQWSLEDKAIDLGIAFESIYAADRNPCDPISQTVRLRAAWHLGGPNLARGKVHDAMSVMYDLRSKAAHTGRLKPTVRFADQQMGTHQFLEYCAALLVQTLKRVFERNGFPDWVQLVLDEAPADS